VFKGCRVKGEGEIKASHSSSSHVTLGVVRGDQAEVHCVERGRALATIWNTYIATVEPTIARLRGGNDHMRGVIASLYQEVVELREQVKNAEFMRREISRYRRWGSWMPPLGTTGVRWVPQV
jgi:hypothetical protein